GPGTTTGLGCRALSHERALVFRFSMEGRLIGQSLAPMAPPQSQSDSKEAFEFQEGAPCLHCRGKETKNVRSQSALMDERLLPVVSKNLRTPTPLSSGIS